MILNIVDSINDASERFQDWIVANGSNPILWIGLFFGGVLLFFITYNALHKD